jgi:NADH-quinone oxidoreductase subunit G
MPKLTIDNREVTVPEGANVLDAARALDIVIPHFCYHEALGAVGSCRLCAVKFEDGPVKGLLMSCMVPAQDGMVVSTVDPAAEELRAHVVEWAMTNHPHDCPVCDEGGECQLQDMTVAGGHALRRYTGKKQTYTNQDLGPFVVQEANRCITCYRCVRTYKDYCGGSDFGVFGSRNRVFFGRVQEGRLQSPFSGNLVDVCPTGVFTNKTFRFKSRVWDLQEAPSICPHCSLGCATIPGGRYRELQRVRSGINPATNGFFICDRGRFAVDYGNHPDRPRQPRVDSHESTMAEALTAARQRIAAMVAEHGPQSVAMLGSARASLEANALLARWTQQLGLAAPVFEVHRQRDQVARTVAARLGEAARSLDDVRNSDLILLVGADPLAEGPMLALALRQAVRAGGKVVVCDPRPVDLPCDYEQWSMTPEQLPALLDALAAEDLSSVEVLSPDRLESLQSALSSAQRPILIGAADLLGGQGTTALLDAIERLSSTERQAGAMLLLNGPNSYGNALLAEPDSGFDKMLDGIQEKSIRALVCLEADPFREAQDPALAQAALGHLELLVSLDCTPSLAARRADIFLPTRTCTETAGSFVNNEGRLQAFLPVLDPGLPIREIGAGSHPPREFHLETPGSTPEAAWRLLSQILEQNDDLQAIRQSIAETDPRFAGLVDLQANSPGLRLDATAQSPAQPLAELPHSGLPDSLKLLPVQSVAGSTWLAHLSATLVPMRPEPSVYLHPDQAKELALQDGDQARLTTHLGHCHVTICLDERMSAGLVLAPHLWESALDGLMPGGGLLDCRLDREEVA